MIKINSHYYQDGLMDYYVRSANSFNLLVYNITIYIPTGLWRPAEPRQAGQGRPQQTPRGERQRRRWSRASDGHPARWPVGLRGESGTGWQPANHWGQLLMASNWPLITQKLASNYPQTGLKPASNLTHSKLGIIIWLCSEVSGILELGNVWVFV